MVVSGAVARKFTGADPGFKKKQQQQYAIIFTMKND